jgi:hypothetical protein
MRSNCPFPRAWPLVVNTFQARTRHLGPTQRAVGGHFLVVIPTRNLVVVHRFDNDPPTKDVRTVFGWAYKGINNAEFSPLLQLVLDAQRR